MKIWLDDVRPPPDDTWAWATCAKDFSAFFADFKITEISFDHDIASEDYFGNEITGYHLLCGIEKEFQNNPDFQLPKMQVHSANPVGRQRMQKVIDALERRDNETRTQVR
jgi:hypothetical protein